MKRIAIMAPQDLDCDIQSWEAVYGVEGTQNVRSISIQSRSAIEVIVAKITQTNLLGTQAYYYISSPNFGIAIPSISTLEDTYWITEQLLQHDMSGPDAVTVAQILRDLGDF